MPTVVFVMCDFLAPPGLDELNYLEPRYRKIDYIFQMEELMASQTYSVEKGQCQQ